jgi:origin recognition complex subunit 6
MAGVESVLTLPPPGTEYSIDTPRLEGKIPALIAAIWFFVAVRMRGRAEQGKETSLRKKLARESLINARSNPIVVGKVGDEEENWKAWEEVDEKDVNAWRKEIVGRGWREMDWFANVQEGVGVELEDGDVEEGGSDEDMDMGGKDGQERGQRGNGQGKVVLDKYDYLSEAKQRDYQEWRTALLAEVHGLLEEAINEESDVEMS